MIGTDNKQNSATTRVSVALVMLAPFDAEHVILESLTENLLLSEYFFGFSIVRAITTIEKPESLGHIMAEVAEVKSCCDTDEVTTISMDFNWSDREVWGKSAYNTMWCLIGCSIGDLGTIAAFQFVFTDSGWSTMNIMMLAMFNGIMTSIILETIILSKQMILKEAFKVAVGMSLISMIGMEAAMNIVDYLLTGGAMLTWWVIPIMLFAGFITPWPYNYWRLKKYGKACH